MMGIHLPHLSNGSFDAFMVHTASKSGYVNFFNCVITVLILRLHYKTLVWLCYYSTYKKWFDHKKWDLATLWLNVCLLTEY
jgi:hypothetical protein